MCGAGDQSKLWRALPEPSWLEHPAATAGLLTLVVNSAVGLSLVVWHILVGEAPRAVPITAAIVAPVVGLPLLLYLQHVIRHLACSQRTLTQLTAQLAAATEAAELASGAKSEFLARMSHELRTPLNAVIGYSEMLLEDAEAGSIAAAHAADLKRINGAGQHLLSLVNDVLDLSKIEAGRMAVQAQPIELAAFVDDIAAASRPLVAVKRNELRVEHAADLGIILGDAVKLRQVLLNLLSNAAKFTENGRVTLAVRRERQPSGDWISIAVSDTGIGIERDMLARLFTNFTQADPAIAAKYGGTGLGLALSRKLCRLMGGELSAESQPGRGSQFTLRVPAQSESSVVSSQLSVATADN
jgi:signal transduction histidine kinase